MSSRPYQTQITGRYFPKTGYKIGTNAKITSDQETKYLGIYWQLHSEDRKKKKKSDSFPSI